MDLLKIFYHALKTCLKKLLLTPELEFFQVNKNLAIK